MSSSCLSSSSSSSSSSHFHIRSIALSRKTKLELLFNVNCSWQNLWCSYFGMTRESYCKWWSFMLRNHNRRKSKPYGRKWIKRVTLPHFRFIHTQELNIKQVSQRLVDLFYTCDKGLLKLMFGAHNASQYRTRTNIPSPMTELPGSPYYYPCTSFGPYEPYGWPPLVIHDIQPLSNPWFVNSEQQSVNEIVQRICNEQQQLLLDNYCSTTHLNRVVSLLLTECGLPDVLMALVLAYFPQVSVQSKIEPISSRTRTRNYGKRSHTAVQTREDSAKRHKQ